MPPQVRVNDPETGESRVVEVGPVNQLTLSSSPTPPSPSISQTDIDLGRLQQLQLVRSTPPDPVINAQLRDLRLGVSPRPAMARMPDGTPVPTAWEDARYAQLQWWRQGIGRLTDPLHDTDYAEQLREFGEPDSPEKRTRATDRALTGFNVAGLEAAPITKALYSRLDRDLLNAVTVPSHPNRIKTLLSNVASKEEADYRGLTSWLDAKGNEKVTPSDLQTFLAEHPHGVNEIRLGGGARSRAMIDRDIADARGAYDRHELSRAEFDSVSARLGDEWDHADDRAPRWDREDVNLPGGDRYREYVFTLPPRTVANPRQPNVPTIAYAEPIASHLMSTGHPSTHGPGPHPITETGFTVKWAPTAAESGLPSLLDTGASSNQGRIVEWPEGVGYFRQHYSEGPRQRFQINSPHVQNSWHATLDDAKRYLEGAYTDTAFEQARRANASAARQLNYTTNHWTGIQNPVAHLRMDDRITVHGEPAALIQEGQSDWHQQGREVGYRGEMASAEKLRAAEDAYVKANLAEADARGSLEKAVRDSGLSLPNDERWQSSQETHSFAYWAIKTSVLSKEWTHPSMQWSDGQALTDKIAQIKSAASAYELRYAERQNAEAATNRLHRQEGGVPDAPFKDTGWQKLTFNRALADAVENQKDWLLWTTGDQQAARYDNLLEGVKEVELHSRDGEANLIVRGDFGEREFEVGEFQAEGADPADGNAAMWKNIKKYIGPRATERLRQAKATPPDLAPLTEKMRQLGFDLVTARERMADAADALNLRGDHLRANTFEQARVFANNVANVDAIGERLLHGHRPADLESLRFAANDYLDRHVDWEQASQALGRAKQKLRAMPSHSLDTSKEPLKITSAGMVQQYDENWVNYAKKLGKPYGATVEKVKAVDNSVTIGIAPADIRSVGNDDLPWLVRESNGGVFGATLGTYPNREAARVAAKEMLSSRRPSHEVWGLKLTPELKQAISQKGVALMETSPREPGLSIVGPPTVMSKEGWQKLVASHPEHLHQPLADLQTRLHAQSNWESGPREAMHAIGSHSGTGIGDVLTGDHQSVFIPDDVVADWAMAPGVITAHTHPVSSTFSYADLSSHNQMIALHGIKQEAMLVFGRDGSWYELRWASKPLSVDALRRTKMGYDRLIDEGKIRASKRMDDWLAKEYDLQVRHDPALGTLFRPSRGQSHWQNGRDILLDHPEGVAHFDRLFRDEVADIWTDLVTHFDGHYRYHLAP